MTDGVDTAFTGLKKKKKKQVNFSAVHYVLFSFYIYRICFLEVVELNYLEIAGTV